VTSMRQTALALPDGDHPIDQAASTSRRAARPAALGRLAAHTAAALWAEEEAGQEEAIAQPARCAGEGVEAVPHGGPATGTGAGAAVFELRSAGSCRSSLSLGRAAVVD
jgi:hypothetical protein